MSVLFATGLCVTWFADEAEGPATRTSPTLPLVELLAAAILASVSFVWLKALNPAPVPGRNEVFLTVVDCLLFEQCYTVGQGSSVLLNNGAVWPEVALAIKVFGGSVTDLYTVVVAQMAVGVGLVFLIAARFLNAAVAVPAAVFALALLGSFRFASPLVDCSFTFLFSAAAAAALLTFALTTRPLALVIAAVFASHAVNSHVCAVVLLPALVLFSTMAGDSPFWSAGIAGVSYLAASAITSLQALTGNWVALWGSGLWWLAILGVAALVVVGLRFNQSFRSLPSTAKTAVAAVLLVVPYGLGVLVLIVIDHLVRPEYLPPVIAPVSVLAAMLLAKGAGLLAPARIGNWARFLCPMVVSLFCLSLNP